MRILIVEDEHISAEKLRRQLLAIMPSAHIAAMLQSVAETRLWLQANTCDLIFLDIHLSDGLSFEIFGGADAPAPIIFTTAYDEYAIRAFKLNSIDYLLKPIAKQDLQAALHKYQRYQRPQLADTDIASLSLGIASRTGKLFQKSMLVTSGEKIIRFQIADVAYFFAETKHTFAVLSSGQQHIIDTPLDRMEETLDPSIFFRANRKFIINTAAICEMIAWSKSRIKLCVHPPFAEDIIISTEKVKPFKDWLQSAGM